MTRIPRSQATGLEVVAALVGVGVLIGVTVLDIPTLLRLPVADPLMGLVATPINGSLTYLILVLLMPTWGVIGLEAFRLRTQAEAFACWWGRRHPLREQRMECLLRAAYLAWDRGAPSAAAVSAEAGLATAGEGLYLPAVSFYYALCLEVRAWFLQNEGRYQEALEQYGQAVRLHLKPPSLTAQYYAHAAGLLYVLGRFEEAVLFSAQAIAASSYQPDAFTTEAHRWAALSLAELSRPDEAVNHCETGMVIQPISVHNIWLTADRPWLLYLAGQDEKAEVSFAGLKQAATEGALAEHMRQEYQEVLGRVRLSQGQAEEAEALFRASLTDAPRRHLSALYHLSLIAAQKGDEAQALDWRERLLREAPESFYAARVRGDGSSEV